MAREATSTLSAFLLVGIVAGAGFLGGMNFQSRQDAPSLQVCQSSLQEAQLSATRYKAIDDAEHPLFDMLVQYIGDRSQKAKP